MKLLSQHQHELIHACRQMYVNENKAILEYWSKYILVDMQFSKEPAFYYAIIKSLQKIILTIRGEEWYLDMVIESYEVRSLHNHQTHIGQLYYWQNLAMNIDEKSYIIAEEQEFETVAIVEIV